LNRWLAPKFGERYFIDFDFSSISELQDEADKVVDQLAKAWWITPNEKREIMDYGVDEDDELMNDYYIPSSLVPMKGTDLNLPPVADMPSLPMVDDSQDGEDDINDDEDQMKSKPIDLVSPKVATYTNTNE